MKKLSARAIAVLTNSFLALVVLVIGIVCFFPSVSAVSGVDERVYYKGNSPNGVSLMFNVYWGTDIVRRILDVLDEYDAKVTFFIGGCWADDNVSCLQEIADRGHELASHGYFHREHDKLNLRENLEEIRNSVDFLNLATGVEIKLFAPPSGVYCDATVDAAESLGLKMIMWSKDTVDWRDKDSSLVYRRATEGIAGGDLILMHPMEHTLQALPDVLSYYKNNDLRVIPVGENIAG